MIYTTYFANLKNLYSSIIPVSICLYPPAFYDGYGYEILAPSRDILMKYKADGDIDSYIDAYTKHLNTLDLNIVVSDFKYISNGHDIALVCYEKYDKFCHRHIVADWLNKNGIECKEYGHEDVSLSNFINH